MKHLCVIKCVKFSELKLATNITYPYYIMNWNFFAFSQLENPTELKSFQHSKSDPNLAKRSKNPDENVM